MREFLSATFAVIASAICVTVVGCAKKDPIMCSILHPISYFMVVLLMSSAIVLLKGKPWF